MKKLLSQIVSAIAGLWLATLLPLGVVVKAYPSSNFFGFPITADWQMFIVLGVGIGSIFYFIKPLLKTFDLPLEVISLGFFTILVEAGFLWLIDMIFDELHIPVPYPLLYTTLIIWGLNLIIQKIIIKEY
jgi:uncharacterized membrane protein YvlD (DUF360 family)